MERLKQIRARVNVMPLGSGALAGNPFAVDRTYLAHLLEFDNISPNSLLAVGDRDFVGIFLHLNYFSLFI
jgi:argininosuccinate lyase